MPFLRDRIDTWRWDLQLWLLRALLLLGLELLALLAGRRREPGGR